VGVSEADLPRILIDHDGRQHHASFPFGGTPDSAVRDLRDLAGREVHPMLAALVAATRQPFLQTIVDVEPTRTVFGRVCLLGGCGVRRPAAHGRRHRQGGPRRGDVGASAQASGQERRRRP
jgi:hypothetical protein